MRRGAAKSECSHTVPIVPLASPPYPLPSAVSTFHSPASAAFQESNRKVAFSPTGRSGMKSYVLKYRWHLPTRGSSLIGAPFPHILGMTLAPRELGAKGEVAI